jgi:hypothetical protein
MKDLSIGMMKSDSQAIPVSESSNDCDLQKVSRMLESYGQS